MKQSSVKKTQAGVLLLGNYRPTMPVARTFREHGYCVTASLAGCDRGAEYSRFVDDIWDHPLLSDNPSKFIAALQTFIRQNPNIKAIVPISEEYTRLFADQTIELSHPVKILTPNNDIAALCLDKVQLLSRANELGLPVAPFIMVNSLERILDAGKAFGYPLVIRPEQSTNRLFEKKALTVNDAQEVSEKIPCWPEGHENLLVQRKVGGIRHNLYFAARHGSLERVLHSKILRTDRPDGSGLAVEGITVRPDSALMYHTQTLIRNLTYTGIGCAQFLVDEKTGELHFLEINPRIAGNHALPEHCRMALGEWLIANAFGNADTPVEKFVGKPGVRYSWLAGDLQGLKMAWRQEELSLRQAVSWLVQACKTFLQSDMDIMLNKHDPKPGLIALFKVLTGTRFKFLTSMFSTNNPEPPTNISAPLTKVPTHENARPS